jgi:lipopolysaccharide transport system permease protein
MRSKLPGIDDTLAYSIYLCAGIIPWQFFTEVLMRCINVFVDQGNLLKKVSFPRSSLPLFVFLSGGINFIIIFAIYLVFLLIIGRLPGITILAVIPLLMLQISLAVGLGILLGTLNVFFRDVGHIMGIILQFWFWLTPMVYPYQVVPERFRLILELNPLVGVVRGYQDIFLYDFWPVWEKLIPIAIVSVISLVLGYLAFVKLDKEMVDEL